MSGAKKSGHLDYPLQSYVGDDGDDGGDDGGDGGLKAHIS